MSKTLQFSNRRELIAIECPADKKQVEVWHTDIAGFGARIMRPSVRTGDATRTYIHRWKDAAKKDHKDSLGRFEEISFEDALAAVMKARQAQRYEKSTGMKPLPTFKEAFDCYLKDREGQLKESTLLSYKQMLGNLSKWENDNVGLMDSNFWIARYDELLPRSRSTAESVLRLVHAVYQSLVDDEKLNVNPVRRLVAKKKIYAKNAAKTPALKTTELSTFWGWLETRAHTSVRDMCRIVLLMGIRSAVVGQLKWENVDMSLRLLQVPAEMRGNKANQLVWIPLPDWLYENVFKPRLAAKLPGAQWVIPSPKKAGQALVSIRGSLSTCEAETKVRAGPHILRRTFATVALLATHSDILASRMLTHTQKSNGQTAAPVVTGGYITPDETIMRQCFEATSALMLAYCRGEVTRTFAVDLKAVDFGVE